MKYNKNYRPKKKKAAKKRVKNPSSKTFISLQEIVDREGAGVGIENFKDKRTVPGGPYQIVVKDRANKFEFYVVDKTPKRNNPTRPSRRRSRTAESATEVAGRTNKVTASTEEIEEYEKGIGAGETPALIIPPDANLAFSLGVVHGFEQAKKDCPTSDVLGIGIVSPKWRKITEVIKEKKADEARRVLRSAQDPYPEIDKEAITGGYQARDWSFVKQDEPVAAYTKGVYLGRLYGYEACPLKWMPFSKSMNRIRQQIRSIEDWRQGMVDRNLKASLMASEALISRKEQELGG